MTELRTALIELASQRVAQSITLASFASVGVMFGLGCMPLVVASVGVAELGASATRNDRASG